MVDNKSVLDLKIDSVTRYPILMKHFEVMRNGRKKLELKFFEQVTRFP